MRPLKASYRTCSNRVIRHSFSYQFISNRIIFRGTSWKFSLVRCSSWVRVREVPGSNLCTCDEYPDTSLFFVVSLNLSAPMSIIEEVEVELHAFLTSALDGLKWSAALSPGKELPIPSG
jgi:hypothetical protein